VAFPTRVYSGLAQGTRRPDELREGAQDMKRTRPVVVTLMVVLFVVMGFTGCATVPPVSTVAERQRGTIAFPSMTLSTTQFLRGARDGTPAVVSGN
jgi:hypothetical protein